MYCCQSNSQPHQKICKCIKLLELEQPQNTDIRSCAKPSRSGKEIAKSVHKDAGLL